MAKFIIPSIFTAVDKFSPAMKAMGKNISAFAERASRKIQALEKDAQKIGKATLIGGLALAAPLIVATKAAADFEAKMSNVATLLDTNKEDMGAMGQEVLSLAQKLPVPIEELTSSLYDIRSAGVPSEKAMATLEAAAKLSAAGLATASESTNVMTSAMNAFASEGLTTSQIADTLFKTVKAGKTNLSEIAQAFGATAPTVQAAGVKLADFQAATAALTTVGTPAAQAQNQIRASVIAMQKPTADMTKIFAKLGVKGGTDLIKKTGGLVPAFEAIEKQGRAMGLNMAKAWSSVEAGAAVTSLTGATNSAYVTTLSDMTKGANAVDEAFEKQAATSKSQMQLMKNNMEALSITAGQVLLPILNKIIERVIPLIQGFGKWARENQKLFKGIVIGVAALSGFLLVVSGISFAVAAASKVMVAWGLITKTIVAVQWLLNAAMFANPIGLIIIGVVALIAVIAVIINKYNEWGAAMSLALAIFLPGLMMIINLVQSFRRNWDAISDAFASGNILQGFKLIGATILDSILMPLQQVFSLMTNLPGVGKFAQSAVDKIGELRTGIGVNTITDESGNQTEMAKSAPLINTQAEKEENMRKMFAESRSRVDLNVNDKNGRTEVKSTSPDVFVKLTPTM